MPQKGYHVGARGDAIVAVVRVEGQRYSSSAFPSRTSDGAFSRGGATSRNAHCRRKFIDDVNPD